MAAVYIRHCKVGDIVQWHSNSKWCQCVYRIRSLSTSLDTTSHYEGEYEIVNIQPCNQPKCTEPKGKVLMGSFNTLFEQVPLTSALSRIEEDD